MRWAVFFYTATALIGCANLLGDEKPAPLLPCPPGASEAACNPSREDLKEAKAAFAHGLKLQQNAPDQAFVEFEHAARLVPRNVEYVTARELSRQQLVSHHLERGNTELEAGKQIEALADFRGALQLDPSNEFAQQRLRDAAGDSVPQTAGGVSIVEESPIVRLVPDSSIASFHFRGDNRELLANVARAFGVSAQVDESVKSKTVTFNVDNVDFYAAMIAAQEVTKTFWTALDSKQLLVAADTPENRRLYERIAMRTFYVPTAATTPTALNDSASRPVRP